MFIGVSGWWYSPSWWYNGHDCGSSSSVCWWLVYPGCHDCSHAPQVPHPARVQSVWLRPGEAVNQPSTAHTPHTPSTRVKKLFHIVQARSLTWEDMWSRSSPNPYDQQPFALLSLWVPCVECHKQNYSFLAFFFNYETRHSNTPCVGIWELYDEQNWNRWQSKTF